jgi:alanine transaminase
MALKEQGEKLPFDKFYPLHYGNPQLLGQPPITFLRQVIAGTLCPSLLEADVFPDSVIRRVRLYLKAISNGAMGGYSDASGFDVFRKAVSKYISKRDDCECDFNNIYLTDGALDGMIFMNNLIFSKKDAGIMLPVPGFPRYSFLAEQVQGKTVNYSLIEEKNWAIDVFFHLDDRL